MARINEVRPGQIWAGRVSQRFVNLEVLDIVKPTNWTHGNRKTFLKLKNLATGREIERTAAFLRRKIS